MFSGAIRYFITPLQRQALALRPSYGALHVRRAMYSTSQSGAEKTGTKIPEVSNLESEEITQEILDRVPRDVHEEMAEAAGGYREQLRKLEASPNAVKALKAMQDTAKELGVDIKENYLLNPYTIVKLASDARMRDVTRTAFIEMQKAGVDAEKIEQIVWAMQTLSPEKLEDERAEES